ncbi:MAG TPA: kelch repeat-containing protein, partial [Tepidiformaceae bacterium]
GRVLVAGGSNENDSSAEIYDPSTGTFSPTGSMMQSRLNGSAVLLPDGRVLLVGGSASSPTSAETYWP